VRSEFGAQPSPGGGEPRQAAIPGFLAGMAANVLGGVVVLVLLVFVAPVPREVAHNLGLGLVNIALFGAYVGISVVAASRRVQSIRAPVDAWLASGRPPTPAERELTLRLPVRGLEVTAALWAAAAVVFGIFNAFWSVGLGLMVAFGIALGGLTTCAVVALVVERFARDDVAAALRSGVPEEPVGPGVATGWP
jgi:adenylate cyclase